MSKRRSRAMDPDIKALCAMDRALRATTPRVREYTLQYLWDKFILRPPAWLAEHDAQKFAPKAPAQVDG